MQRDLASFPLPPAIRFKFKDNGFSVVEDVIEMKPSELSREIGISKEESLEILKMLREATSSLLPCQPKLPSNTASTSSGRQPQLSESNKRTVTALEMLRDEKSSPAIVTFCEDLDEMLGGGVPLCKITELCGAPGVGKTQTCIQLAVDVQIPQCFGGVDGEAIYIDTEGSFLPQRAADMALAMVEHCRQIVDTNDTEQQTVLADFSVEKLLSGIHFFRCHDYTELLALVNLLPEILEKHKKVKLVVIDSIAFHFRHDFDDLSLRTRLLNGLAQSLIKIASEHRLAVVLTNQMTTHVGDGPSHLIPALGESWGHACTVRLVLFWKDSQRYANLYKSPNKQEMTVPYQITMDGLRSVPRSEDELQSRLSLRCKDAPAGHDDGHSNPSKRPRPNENQR
ncbi:DNA repair protein RAD51 homolog 3-like isoform X2 [Acanthaster planci]|uniref:DNA repair protein RAD51 homolog 3 n=1 Tax=Acanthaster planci TaxID=133434 RepID=A0A8B7Y273_ACAPL|nr:DNA repair protein RAD51 homolog 3-like isoform X2 [Acanthaster planci]